VAIAEGDVDSVAAHARKLLALTANLDPRAGSGGDQEEERRDLASAILRVAVTLLGAHRSADAQGALDGALRLYPNHSELSFYRAVAVVQRGHPREGALAFEAVERRAVIRGRSFPRRRSSGRTWMPSSWTRACRRRWRAARPGRRRSRCAGCERCSPPILVRKR